jgi:hypothetical protein
MSSSYYGKAPLHRGCVWGCLTVLLVVALMLLAGIPVILNFVLDGVRTW